MGRHDGEQLSGPGVLVLAATPIGNPADASRRLSQELAEADVVAAEDTRRLRRLVAALEVQVRARVISYFEGNEESRTAEVVSALEQGARVVLVTDAGTPSVSDPGYRLVQAAVAAGVRVTAVPGPSAVVTALAVSGLPVDRFAFEGFPPRRVSERSRWMADLAGERRTMVFFESRHRLAATLQAMVEAFDADRHAVVCRELTKKHEEVRRDTLEGLARWAGESEPLGEVTIVVAGLSSDDVARRVVSMDQAVGLVEERVTAGASRRDAIAEIAREAGLSRRELYAAVVEAPR